MRVTLNGVTIQEPVTNVSRTADIIYSGYSGTAEFVFGFGESVSPFAFFMNKIGDKMMDGMSEFFANFLTDFISVFPIIFVFAIGVRILLGMINKTVANWGVGLVFVYGALVVMFA